MEYDMCMVHDAHDVEEMHTYHVVWCVLLNVMYKESAIHVTQDMNIDICKFMMCIAIMTSTYAFLHINI